MKKHIYNLRCQKPVAIFFVLMFSFLFSPFLALNANAQTLTSPTDNPSLTNFQLSVCDGPPLPQNQPANYVPCNFNTFILQIQHLIDVMIVLGVLAAIGGFTYAGYLYISAGIRGDADAHGKALGVFKKIAWGFIIMLSAWFIVYQIMAWLTGTSGFAFLLGNK